METRVCPICLKCGLLPLVKYEPWEGEEVLCSNDDFVHVIRFGNEYLAHTQINILTELEPELVLN